MFDVYVKLAWFFKEHWKRYSLAIVLLSLVNVLAVIPARLVGLTIDGIYQRTLTFDTLLFFIILLSVILVIDYVASYYWQHYLYGGAE